MEAVNLLHFENRSELRQWLKENHNKEKCCWVVTYRSKCPPEWPAIPYIEVVEEALCFGWIDSTLKRLPDGRLAQRLSLRRAKSHWTPLNMDRCWWLKLVDKLLKVRASEWVKIKFSIATSTAEVQGYKVDLKSIQVRDYSTRLWDKPKDKRGSQIQTTWDQGRVQ